MKTLQHDKKVNSKITLCLVLYSPKLAEQLIKKVTFIKKNIVADIDIYACISNTSTLTIDDVSSYCTKHEVYPVNFLKFDDTFLDYSAYEAITKLEANNNGVGHIYINDTLISKHNSNYLLRLFIKNINLCVSEKFMFPILIGPYVQSEYSINNDSKKDEFVSTFMFFLTNHGVRLFSELLDNMPLIKKIFVKNDDCRLNLINNDILNFCNFHKLRLINRVKDQSDKKEYLERKLTTVYMEQSLSEKIRQRGLIWYIGRSNKDQLIIQVQKLTSKLSI